MEDRLEYNSIFDAIASSPEEAAEMKSESDARIKARDEEHRGGNATAEEPNPRFARRAAKGKLSETRH